MSARKAIGLLLTALAATVPAAWAAGTEGDVTLRADSASVSADARHMWHIGLTVGNTGSFGVYLDSLVVVSTPLEGPQSGKLSRTRLPFTFPTLTISTGEEQNTHIQLAATRVRTRLDFELSSHTHDRSLSLLSVSVVAGGFDPETFYPSTRAMVAGRRIEMRRFEPSVEANGGGVLLLPEPGTDLIPTIDLALQLAGQGFGAVVLTSPPGAGDPADRGSVAGASAALDTLAGLNGVSPQRRAAWGVGAGGTLALALADARPELAAVIAQSAVVPRMKLNHVKAPVLLLHGEKDSVAPILPVRDLALALRQKGAPVDTSFAPSGGHDMNMAASRRVALRFLQSHANPKP